MSLAQLSLAIFLILFAINAFGWAVITPVILGLFAIIAGMLILLDGSGFVTYRLPVSRNG